MDLFIGFDVSLASTAICVLSDCGKVVREASAPSEPEALTAFLQGLSGNLEVVGLEAGPLSQWLHMHLTAAGFEVVLMETRHVKGALKAMPIKTDRRDAFGIARLLQMGWFRPVHCKSVSAQEMRAVLTTRKAILNAAIKLEQSVRGVLRNFGLKMGNQVALACGVSAKTAAKWYRRFKSAGLAGLQDRSSRPRKLRASTPEHVCDYIIALRRQRLTAAHIAAKTGVSPATVSRVLRRAGLSRLRDLEPAEPVRRYERDHPGDMIHLDIKRLGKFDRIGHRITGMRTGQSSQRSRRAGPGWEYVHVCVDDASRLSFTQIHPDEKAVSAVAHLRAAFAWYVSMGVKVSRVMTDNGACYKSHAFKSACTELGIRHVRTKPYAFYAA